MRVTRSNSSTAEEMICHNIDCRVSGRVIHVENGDTHVSCGKCNAEYHGKCVPLTPGSIKDLVAGNLFWYCGTCKPAVQKLLAGFDETNKRCDNIEAQLETLNQSIGAKIDALAEKVSGGREDVSVSSQAVQISHPNVVAEAVKEMQDINRRKSNIMLFNWKIPPNSPPGDIKNLFGELLVGIGLQPTEHGVLFIGQVGKESAGRPRAVKAVFQSEASVRLVLANTSKLADCGDGRFKEISIRPDLTPTQQAEHKLLVDELRAKKRPGRNFRIRHGRVVEVPVAPGAQPVVPGSPGSAVGPLGL